MEQSLENREPPNLYARCAGLAIGTYVSAIVGTLGLTVLGCSAHELTRWPDARYDSSENRIWVLDNLWLSAVGLSLGVLGYWAWCLRRRLPSRRAAKS